MKGTTKKNFGKSGRSGAVLTLACLFIMTIALVFGFAACDSDGDDDDGNTDPKSVTITGLDSYAMGVVAVLGSSLDDHVALGAGTITSGSFTAALVVPTSPTSWTATSTAWTGNGGYYVLLQVKTTAQLSSGGNGTNFLYTGGKTFTELGITGEADAAAKLPKWSFDNTASTIAFSQFVVAPF
jgi:hypothetical protein